MSSRPLRAAAPACVRLHATPTASAICLAFSTTVLLAVPGFVLAQTTPATTTAVPAEANLAPVTVSAQRVAPGTTENSGSYTTDSMSSATRLNLSIRETPQSVGVITRQQMDDQNIQSLEDVTSVATGLTLSKGATERASFFSRGFSINYFTQDGLPISSNADTLGFSTLAMYDRIEVLRGPAGLLTGAGNPSGSINLVRKRATRDPQVSITGSLGRYNSVRTELDASGALNEDKTLRGRFVTAVQDADTFIVNYKNKRQLAYGTVELDITPATTVSVGFHYNNEENPGSSWYGLPTAFNGQFLPLDRSATITPAWAFWNKVNTRVFAEVEHTFANDWKLKVAAQHLNDKLDSEVTQFARFPAGTNQFRLTAANKFIYDRQQDSFDAQISGPFSLLGRKHEAVFGAMQRTMDQADLGYEAPGGYFYNFTPVNWNPSAPQRPAFPRLYYGQSTTTKQTGLYSTGRFRIADPLTVILGGRVDSFEYKAVNPLLGTTTSRYKVNAEFTPYAGVVYDVDKQHSLYASWTSVFNPNTAVDASGVLLDPVTGTNTEAGIKGEYFAGALNWSAAVFDIRQKNLAVSLPLASCRPGLLSCSEAAGEVQSRGIELDVSGALTSAWQIGAGLTYNKAKYTKDQGNNKAGTVFAADRPTRLLRVSTSYRLPGEWNAFRIGGAVRSQNEMYRLNNAIRQAGYTIVDLSAGWKVSKQLDVRVNMTNVFDKKYYQAIGSTVDSASAFGEPRNFQVTAKYTF